MAIEIERKYLVLEIPNNLKSVNIKQGYLQTDASRTVRIRSVQNKSGPKGFITIKGISNSSGMSRYEFETSIPFADALNLLSLCDTPLLEKTRYQYEYDGFIWEIDEFHGVNKGLIIAEIELESEHQSFDIPSFIGEEVTGQYKYYNSELVSNPFSKWKK
jgi:adenylate cyclase